jgi:hypothetical protein
MSATLPAAPRVASRVPAPVVSVHLVIVRAVGCPVVCRAAGVMDGHPWLRGEKKILGCPCASKITHLNVYPP